ncbi:MAG: hypothetical protein FWG68_07245 [Defluviitaleaceae bacterium]|nr:hypothetical protein [Defluviitaleaceae bacterium]
MSALWSPITAATSSNTVAEVGSRNTSGELDRDAFLQLLVTQMQHQDPLNPMDDRDFLAQMAQFSALEQQQIMTRSMELQQAHNMIGKSVFAQFFDETANIWRQVDGPVLSVTRAGGNILLGVETMVPRLDDDGQPILTEAGEMTYDLRVIDTPLDRITFVSDDYFMSQQLQGILNGVANARDLGLIGRYVQAILADENGNPSEFIEGAVEFVRFISGEAVLMVNGREIFSSEVFSVSDGPLVVGRALTSRSINADNTLSAFDGIVAGISVVNGNAMVDFTNGNSARVNRIDQLVEGLQLVGRTVTHNLEDFDGVVSRVLLQQGDVFLQIGNGQPLSLTDFRNGGRVIPNMPGGGNADENGNGDETDTDESDE